MKSNVLQIKSTSQK